MKISDINTINSFLVVLLGLFPTLVWPYKQVRSNIGGRIIGGTAANAGQFPHAAAITVQTSNSRFFCGGTLIESQWVLTAGQCVDGATLFSIALGSNTLNDQDPNRVTLATSEYFIHPEYNTLTLENDIGLIKLRMPIQYSTYLNKVNGLGESLVVAGIRLLAIGWGQTSEDNPEFSNELQWAEVSALSTAECQLTYGNQIGDNTICIDGNYNEGACYGDTGSGLIQPIAMGRGFFLAGISSFISGNGCESPDPSGYIRIPPYNEWIRSTVQENL